MANGQRRNLNRQIGRVIWKHASSRRKSKNHYESTSLDFCVLDITMSNRAAMMKNHQVTYNKIPWWFQHTITTTKTIKRRHRFNTQLCDRWKEPRKKISNNFFFSAFIIHINIFDWVDVYCTHEKRRRRKKGEECAMFHRSFRSHR